MDGRAQVHRFIRIEPNLLGQPDRRRWCIRYWLGVLLARTTLSGVEVSGTTMPGVAEFVVIEGVVNGDRGMESRAAATRHW